MQESVRKDGAGSDKRSVRRRECLLRVRRRTLNKRERRPFLGLRLFDERREEEVGGGGRGQRYDSGLVVRVRPLFGGSVPVYLAPGVGCTLTIRTETQRDTDRRTGDTRIHPSAWAERLTALCADTDSLGEPSSVCPNVTDTHTLRNDSTST